MQDNSVIAPSFAPPVGYAPPPDVIAQDTRGLFESDHAFDGFVEPLSNPIQSKDPRALTEIRFLTMFDWSRPSTPVIGGGTIQVYYPGTEEAHTNPTRQRGECLRALAGASG